MPDPKNSPEPHIKNTKHWPSIDQALTKHWPSIDQAFLIRGTAASSRTQKNFQSLEPQLVRNGSRWARGSCYVFAGVRQDLTLHNLNMFELWCNSCHFVLIAFHNLKNQRDTRLCWGLSRGWSGHPVIWAILKRQTSRSIWKSRNTKKTSLSKACRLANSWCLYTQLHTHTQQLGWMMSNGPYFF